MIVVKRAIIPFKIVTARTRKTLNRRLLSFEAFAELQSNLSLLSLPLTH
jgi:hypothetical protein